MIRYPAGYDGTVRIKRHQDYYQAGYGVSVLSASPFSPLFLFAAGEQGVWYDPSDFTTLFQDAAGTIPVTAIDQPVGLMLDKSGRGNHASQAIAASRPTLKQDTGGFYYLLFDGSNDIFATNNIDFSGTDKITVFSGVRKLVNSNYLIVTELSNQSGANNGTFALLAPGDTGYIFTSRGTSLAVAQSTPFAAPDTAVLTGLGDISGNSVVIRRNGTVVGSSTASQGTGNFGSAYPLYIGARQGPLLQFNGRLYSLIIRGGLSTPAQIAYTEAWVNTKTGAY